MQKRTCAVVVGGGWVGEGAGEEARPALALPYGRMRACGSGSTYASQSGWQALTARHERERASVTSVRAGGVRSKSCRQRVDTDARRINVDELDAFHLLSHRPLHHARQSEVVPFQGQTDTVISQGHWDWAKHERLRTVF